MFVNRYLFLNVFHINSGCVFSLEIPYFGIFSQRGLVLWRGNLFYSIDRFYAERREWRLRTVCFIRRFSVVHNMLYFLPCEVVVCLKLRVPSNSLNFLKHFLRFFIWSHSTITVPPLLINLRQIKFVFTKKDWTIC